MVSGEATLVLDLGNSSTRVATKYGKNSKGNPREKINVVSNAFGTIPENMVQSYLNNDVYSEENSRIFRCNDEVYCNGKICSTEFESTVLRPTSLEKKYNSLAAKLAIINGFCKGYEAIAGFTDNAIDGIDVKWNLVMLLPPEDIETGAKELAEMARSIKKIKFLMPKIEKDIEIQSVKIFPEGFAAYIAVVFEEVGKVREGYADLIEDGNRTLIVDIGGGTTDYSLADGASIIASTRFTREIGGNNVHQRMRKLMRDKGYTLSDSAARAGCEKGFVKIGAQKVECIEEIQQAKKEVARQLVDSVQEFFENTMLAIQSINNILIVGGGAEESNVDGIKPISNYIMEFMQRLSKNIGLVQLPVSKKEVDGVVTEVKMSPRMCNIIGACILADFGK